MGDAYVALARSNAGHCAVMFRTDLVDTDDAHLQLCGMGAYAVIEGVVARLLESLQSTVELDHATWMCWSTMQGLVQLEPKFQVINAARGREPVSTQDLIDRFSDLLVNAFRPAARADSIVDDIHDAS